MTLLLDRVKALTYQGAKTWIKKMDDEQVAELLGEVNEALDSMYARCQNFGNGKCNITVAEYSRTMGGIKKLEVIYGYVYDRLNSTELMSVR